ncbi:hypothetical protein ACFWR9_06190 [Streptomyces sp. NPDC058534]|uniref:hypothetical protein n=1 Tax=Streptomyces sp. NPDC058534 TaxID=3346541 RepID=UPI003649D095
MTTEWQSAVAEAREATGYTGEGIPRTVDAIGPALRLDHRGDFEYSREQAIDFADVAVSLYARAAGDVTVSQAEINAPVADAEAS